MELATTLDNDLSAVRDVPTLDSHMTYREAGSGADVVFLHGNPTSSYVWRHVIPRLGGRVHALAPDLIGMGNSGKPDIAYRFDDHARYLDAWFEAVGVRDAVLVGYDWGGVLAMHWAARHPARVRGLVVFETFLRPMQWSEWPPRGAELFRNLRTPGIGEKMVLEENQFLGTSFASGVKNGLSDADRAVYDAPYGTPESRRPLLQWPREIPIDGEPEDVVAIVKAYDAWLATSPEVAKLLLTFDAATPLGTPAIVEWARANIAALDVVSLGPAGHHAPEDLPNEITDAIAAWMGRHGFLRGAA